MSLFTELKRRNVFRVAIAYLALAWLLTEVAGTLFPAFGIPDWGVRFLVIVFALGFLPALVISWVYELTPEGIKREKDVVRDASITRLTAKRLDLFTISLIVVAIAFILFDRMWLGHRLEQSTASAAAAVNDSVTTAAPELIESQYPPNSIAVLPFANRSANPNDVFFVDGIHDDLLTYISQIGSLKTISRTSVMQYRDSTKPIPEIASELGVATVLEGGVQRAGEQVRINVQLIDARTDGHLWSQIYDRQLTAANVFAIQSDIAGSIAEALRAKLTPESRERITSVPTENLEALEEYFLGRQSMTTRRVEDLARAVGHFEQAVALDPKFALAHANLAIAYGLYRNYAGLPREEWYAKAQASADRALQLNPQLAEAHTAEGVIKWYRRDHEGAEVAFRRAIQLNPNHAQANQWLGIMLGVSMGRLEEGLEYSRKAVTLNPKSAIMLADFGEVLMRAGRSEKAWQQFQRAVAIEPRFSKAHRLMGDLAIESGEPSQAISSYRKALDIEPGNWRVLRSLGSVYLLLGDDQQAEYWFTLALGEAPLGAEQLALELGRLYLYRGERERAREYFDSTLASNPNDQLALCHLVNFDLAVGDVAVALARFQKAFPGLFDDEPVVEEENHVAVIQLAAVLSRVGEQEQMTRLLDLAWQDAESYDPRHYEDEAAIHALRGEKSKALKALRNVTGYVLLFWRDFVIPHPAFMDLKDDPDFNAINEGFEAEMARQLAQVRELEASGEIPSAPGAETESH